jgi:hypothetical protein
VRTTKRCRVDLFRTESTVAIRARRYFPWQC